MTLQKKHLLRTNCKTNCSDLLFFIWRKDQLFPTNHTEAESLSSSLPALSPPFPSSLLLVSGWCATQMEIFWLGIDHIKSPAVSQSGTGIIILGTGCSNQKEEFCYCVAASFFFGLAGLWWWGNNRSSTKRWRRRSASSAPDSANAWSYKPQWGGGPWNFLDYPLGSTVYIWAADQRLCRVPLYYLCTMRMVLCLSATIIHKSRS